MSDSQGPKSRSIPSWQRQETSKQPANTPPQAQADPQQQPREPRASLIKQASEFLNDESIRDAPIERKKLFLESKGLSESEIDNLLDIQQTPEATIMEDYGIERPEAPQSTPPATPSNPSASPSSTPQDHPQPTTTPPKDHPPIITYPEFLLHAQKPAPLITAPRLLTTLYLASGASATIYGTSKYILEPMVISLTTARHSLFAGASANITTLNAKLESAVSRIPETACVFNQDVSDDTESVNSVDGARFFQRSAGTQTSPRLSRSNSSIASESDERLSSLTQDHTSALLGIQSKLSDVLPTDSETETKKKNPLGDSISELRTYLEKLPRTSYISAGNMVGRKGVNDAVANVKAEIRGVKGVLLSARNFPSGVAAR